MAEQTVNDDHAEIKKRAMRRLFVAGALVSAAIVTLTVLNHKPEKSPGTVTTSKAPVVERAEAVLPPTPASEEIAKDIPPIVPATDTPAPPDSEASPDKLPEPPPPRVINQSATTTPLASPAKSRTEAVATITGESPKTSSPQSITISPQPPTKKPVEHPVVESKPSAPPSPAPSKAIEPPPTKGYVVQLGIFSNHENALQLQKRLADHGIQSYTETRLHVGPFKNKTEADAAMARIRSMGISAVLAPAH